jgi:hypothetical protein
MKTIIPTSIVILFAITTLLCVILFVRVVSLSKSHDNLVVPISLGLVLWMGILMLASLNGFYIISSDGFPKIILGFAPTLITIAALFATNRGRAFLDSLPLRALTWIHVVRIPVEIALYILFLRQLVPELMTFAGRNFDIIGGITAPLIIAFIDWKQPKKRGILLTWNILVLGFLLFIIVNALLSAPLSFQQFGFDQPNVAIAYFPMIWLPGVVVPIVLLSHLTAIRRLL